MKNIFRPLLLAAAAATALSTSACSQDRKYGATNVEDGSNKKIDGDQNDFGRDSVVAGLRRPTGGVTQEQTYESTDNRTGRNRGGQSQK